MNSTAISASFPSSIVGIVSYANQPYHLDGPALSSSFCFLNSAVCSGDIGATVILYPGIGEVDPLGSFPLYVTTTTTHTLEATNEAGTSTAAVEIVVTEWTPVPIYPEPIYPIYP